MRLPDRSSALGLAALFAPQSNQGRFIAPHDDPGVRAADEKAAIEFVADLRTRRHCHLLYRIAGPTICVSESAGFRRLAANELFWIIDDELKWIKRNPKRLRLNRSELLVGF